MGNVSEHFFDATNREVLLRQYTGRAVPGVTTTETQNRPTGQLRASDLSFFDIFTAWNSDSKPVSILYPNGDSVTNTYEADLNPNAPPRSRGNLRVRTTLPGPLGGDQAAITESFVYDTTFGGSCGCGFNFATQVTDGRGNTTYHAYDSHGNRTNTIHAVSSAVEDFEYNNFGQVTAHVLPDNGTGYRRRDETSYYTDGPQAGNVFQRILDSQNLALTTTYEYDAVGNVIRVVDPNGNDSLNVVNQLNEIVQQFSRPVSTSSGSVRYERDLFYDANNNLVRLDMQNVDERGLVSTNAYLTTTYAYDILGRLLNGVQEVDPSHNVVTQFAYDANGNRTLVVNGEASNGHQPNNVVSTLYDERNLPYREIRAPGDPGQSTTQFDYDGNGNLIRTSQGLEDLAAPRVTTYAYDGYNRRTTTTDAMGNVTTTHYDPVGNVSSTRADGELTDLPGSAGNVRLAETAYTYDAMNRLVQTDQAFFDPAVGTNIAGGHALTTTVYSPNSQVLHTVDANTHTNSIAYDTANRPGTVTDPKGNARTSVYDANGNVVLTVEVDLSDLGSPAQTFYTTNAYDGLDRLVQTTDNLGNTTSFAYDSRNNRVALTEPRGNLTHYTYDGLNRLTATTRTLTSNGQGNGTPIGSIVTRQSWDDDSRLTGQTDANSNTTAYSYDPLGRLLKTVFADGTTNGTAYDPHGNPTVTTDANGNVANATYDLLNRLAAKTITRGPGVLGTTSEVFQYRRRVADGAGHEQRFARHTELRFALSCHSGDRAGGFLRRPRPHGGFHLRCPGQSPDLRLPRRAGDQLRLRCPEPQAGGFRFVRRHRQLQLLRAGPGAAPRLRQRHPRRLHLRRAAPHDELVPKRHCGRRADRLPRLRLGRCRQQDREQRPAGAFAGFPVLRLRLGEPVGHLSNRRGRPDDLLQPRRRRQPPDRHRRHQCRHVLHESRRAARRFPGKPIHRHAV